MPGHELELAAARELERVDFFVELQTAAGGRKNKSDVRADLLAWAGDESGELAPEVVVEVKTKLPADVDGVLAQLSRTAAVTGARRAFLFDGRWHEADPTFTRFEAAECPRPVSPMSCSRIPSRLLEQQFRAIRDGERLAVGAGKSIEWEDAVLRAAEPGTNTPLSRLCKSASARLTLARIIAEDQREFGVPRVLATSMANLLGAGKDWKILDPACGLGGALLAAAESESAVSLQGWSLSPRCVSVVHKLAAFCGRGVDLDCSSFEAVLRREVAVDGIISVLPFGVRLRDRLPIGGESSSADLDVLMVDRIARWLKPTGRAVIAVPPRFLFVDSAAALRVHLANKVRVAAVIELPTRIFENMTVPVALVVLECRAPGATLVARLGPDWASQLAPSGDFFRAYQHHIAGENA